MNKKIKTVLSSLGNVFLFAFIIAATVFVLGAVYFLGYLQGYNGGSQNSNSIFASLITKLRNGNPAATSTPLPQPAATVKVYKAPTWTGPELWEAVNKRRQELGVNPLGQRDELCTIAAIRLNELLDLGKLDAHEGFSKLAEREDLKWIYEKYNLSEFLQSGAESVSEAVSLWENTLAHKKILTGGEYVWGCIYAQEGFAVGIAAY